jgi:NADP-dependent 3-hydroxy acid dehydrogenase YdfG
MVNHPVILITGASSGIGAATARLFSKHGYRVVLAARRVERLQSLQDEIESAGGQALALAADMREPAEIEALVEASLEHFGQIDVLFNNAGFGRLDWLENLDPKTDIAAQIETNVLGVIWMARAVLPHMIARRSGHIINMASVAAHIATPTYSVYAASKFAVRGFNESLRREVSRSNIRVSLICPGAVRTEFGDLAGFNRTTRVVMPAWITLDAKDVARAVLRLARRPRRELILPWPMKWAIWANILLPGVMDTVMVRRYPHPDQSL